ncbi:hypothetical protein ACFQZI_19945 [Mucilaginibacter lutimaris]|uniref:Uncharacterized protein n=1 Tax=Mucilaginibacter lutimaris TaxID=931629 RepID=A0ABW2ZLN7_9SPHI
MVPVKDIQEQPLKDLGLSLDFVERCKQMSFVTIADIVATGPEALVHRPGFTFHWLSELITFLQDKKALYLLEGRLPKENTGG